VPIEAKLTERRYSRAMSQENVEVVRRAFDRWNSGDRGIRSDEVDPDLELHSRMLGGVVRGRDGLRSWFEEIDQQFEEWRLHIAEIREAHPDRLLVLGEIHLRGRESKMEFDQPMAWLMDFRDGKLVRMKMFVDRAEALEAAGLEE
jgi:ketosteroid isomerase-like protein